MRALVIEDDIDVARQVADTLRQAMYVVDIAHDGEEGQFLGDTESYDVVLLDIGLPKRDGLSVLQQWRRTGRDMPVLILTARDTWREKVAGLRAGADDYLAKPWDDEKLLMTVNNLLKMRGLQLENLRLQAQRDLARQELREASDLCGLVYESDAMHRLASLAVNVAASDAPILITGPSGAGKEKLAEIVQANSRRRDAPFVRINVGALPEELMESELFGAEVGAYTGLTRLRIGRFEAAHRGTIFLDEIDALSLAGQVKLLRVLQEGQFERVGSDRTLSVNVRIIAATNRDLEQEVAAGRFREDLFFRINVFPIPSVALRERAEDIPLLASHFLSSASRRFGREGLRLSQGDVQRLQAYDWPGNVRELQNVLERAVIISRDGQLRLELPDAEPLRGAACGIAAEPAAGILTEQQKRQRDRAMIERALAQCRGKVFGQGGAAELLGVKPTTLASRIKRWGIGRDHAGGGLRG